HPPTQETTPACRNVCLYEAFRRKQALWRAGTALAEEECVTLDRTPFSDESTMLRRISLTGG
ncbi:MAG: hypothetical protein MUP18_02410, partial [Desulfobacterales bacterium]|nr:hypothetical protein [Desulfobacterales bacterium]